MWQLKYGIRINSDYAARSLGERELITISEVASGKTNLVCPFCDSLLTAKKGKIKQHHFAHTGETCLRVRKGKLPSLPLYDNFHLHLSGRHFQLLKDLWREYGNTDYAIVTVPFELEMKKLFSWTPQGYYFTDLGKIPVGGLSLSKFNVVQEPLILSELDRLANSVEMARAIGGELLEEKLADLKIYQLQLQRILRFTLYFLEIECDNKILHKIGVTSRAISDKPILKDTASPKGLARMDGMAESFGLASRHEVSPLGQPQRLLEIERDLKQHYSNVNINVLNTWQHRGNVELYFKHRYRKFNYRIGKLTEYYRFKDVCAVLEDLCFMQPKVLEAEELEIYNKLSDLQRFSHQ